MKDLESAVNYARNKGYLIGEEVEIAINKVFSYLDGIDLLPYISEFKNRRLYELMDKLEERFTYSDEYSESLFDAVSQDEFADYLSNKYKFNIREITETYYYL